MENITYVGDSGRRAVLTREREVNLQVWHVTNIITHKN
jgi:hypothetical protein